MIEYLDENLGVVKVLNVTEARANFSTVLGDNSSQYIITKNNKPLRVIISYSAYLKLTNKGEEKVAEQVVAQPPITTVKKEAAKPEGHVKGLIEANLNNLSKTSPVKKPLPQPASSERFAAAKVPHEKAKSAELARIDQHPTQIEATAEQDYDENQQGIQQIMRQFSSEPQTKTEGRQNKAVVKEEDTTPQQSEYYKKYKKLYEAFEEKEVPVPSQPPEVTEAKVPAVTSQSPAQPKSASVSASENYWDEATESESEQTEEKPERSASTGEEGDLPSLKDLLKELEDESLSDDEPDKKNLGPKEIDDLINRITNDY